MTAIWTVSLTCKASLSQSQQTMFAWMHQNHQKHTDGMLLSVLEMLVTHQTMEGMLRTLDEMEGMPCHIR